MASTTKLPIKGARGTVEVSGAEGVFFKILIDGKVIKRSKGFWEIPMRNGSTSQLRARGFVPGFTSLHLDGEKVFQFGDHARRFERYVPFVSMLLVLVSPLVGFFAAIIVFFLNLTAVKNPNFPIALRVGLPMLNTFAVGAAIWVLLNSAAA